MSQLYEVQRKRKPCTCNFLKEKEMKPQEKTRFQHDTWIHQAHLLKQRARPLEIREKKTKHF